MNDKPIPAEKIAQIGASIADETRVRILYFLLETPASTTELVEKLGIAQPRVSAHLAELRNSQLVSVSARGRQHVYELRSPEVGDALKSIQKLLSVLSPNDVRATIHLDAKIMKNDSPIRRARTCYDHLAGVEGVRLLDSMIASGWLNGTKADAGGKEKMLYDLSEKGTSSLSELGVELDSGDSKRLFAYGCLDWTERRYHLGGLLGKKILDRLFEERIVERVSPRIGNRRAVKVRRPIVEWLYS